MAEPFLAEIRIFSFGFAPKGWALCNGQLLPINQNQALFSLLGTTYGGDGRVNFGLPNLQGNVPIHNDSGHVLGQKGGEQNHTLIISELPQHLHFLTASTDNVSATNIPTGNVFGNSNPNNIYGPVQNLAALNPQTILNVGGSQPHTNMQPFLVLNFSIALQGIFPSQT
jgi:microcystin-dependent protein